MSIYHCKTNILTTDIKMQEEEEEDEDDYGRLGMYQHASGQSRRAGAQLDPWGQDTMSAAERAAETAHNAAIEAAEQERFRRQNHTMRMVTDDAIKREKEDLPPHPCAALF